MSVPRPRRRHQPAAAARRGFASTVRSSVLLRLAAANLASFFFSPYHQRRCALRGAPGRGPLPIGWVPALMLIRDGDSAWRRARRRPAAPGRRPARGSTALFVLAYIALVCRAVHLGFLRRAAIYASWRIGRDPGVRGRLFPRDLRGAFAYGCWVLDQRGSPTARCRAAWVYVAAEILISQLESAAAGFRLGAVPSSARGAGIANGHVLPASSSPGVLPASGDIGAAVRSAACCWTAGCSETSLDRLPLSVADPDNISLALLTGMPPHGCRALPESARPCGSNTCCTGRVRPRRPAGGDGRNKVGAGQLARAIRIAWIAAGLAVLASGVIGLAAIVWPQAWIFLFTGAPDISAVAATYLRIAALGYAFIGMNTLTQAFQAMGQTFWPLMAVASRAVVLAVGGWLVVAVFDGGVIGLAIVTALGLAVAGGIIAVAFWLGMRRKLGGSR